MTEQTTAAKPKRKTKPKGPKRDMLDKMAAQIASMRLDQGTIRHLTQVGGFTVAADKKKGGWKATAHGWTASGQTAEQAVTNWANSARRWIMANPKT